MAFFPCIYFCDVNEPLFRLDDLKYKKLSLRQKYDKILERAQNREYFFELCIKMFCICDCRGLRMVMENPYSQSHYLCKNFVYKSNLIDKNRRRRGDYFVKPTQYWFLNCEPLNQLVFEPISVTHGTSDMVRKMSREDADKMGASTVKVARSMIHPQYANRFIRQYILPEEMWRNYVGNKE